MTTDTKVTAHTKAFIGDGIKEQRFLVENGTIRVLDDVADFYTSCQSLSEHDKQRILELAAE